MWSCLHAPSLINIMVSVDVNHHVYSLTYSLSSRAVYDLFMTTRWSWLPRTIITFCQYHVRWSWLPRTIITFYQYHVRWWALRGYMIDLPWRRSLRCLRSHLNLMANAVGTTAKTVNRAAAVISPSLWSSLFSFSSDRDRNKKQKLRMRYWMHG